MHSPVLTWGQLRLHSKPIGLLNVSGCFDRLLAFGDRAVDDGFIHPARRAMIHAGTDPTERLKLVPDYQPPDAGKWWTRR